MEGDDLTRRQTFAAIELRLSSGRFPGLVARWSDSTIDLDGGQGWLALDSIQLAVTYSYFYR